ncbi:MAG: adenylate/guanylate cyclase domain-containing protein [Spirochaetia bacterium]|nr:adenylate/guanylate cyclase domain-containing protein [Spirochaetia bacterium]
MMKALTRLAFLIFGDPKRHSLEHRLFSTIAFLNALFNIGGSFTTFYLPNFWTLFFVNFGTGLLFLVLYYFSRVKNIYYVLYWPLNLLGVGYLIFVSIQNGGSLGGSHYYLIPSMMISIILMRKQNPVLVYGITLSLTLGLFALEYYRPETITTFQSRMDRFTDAASNFLFVQFLAGLLIFILSRNLNQERQKSDRLLRNILPEPVADELKARERVEPVHYDSVSMLFTDMVGFTKIAERLSPAELVKELDEVFRAFDEIVRKHGLEKIKTIGDSYMAGAGLPIANQTHAVDAVLCGLAFQRFSIERRKKGGQPWELRLGIHSGGVVAGVVGQDKFAYDVWGDTVNTASRLESAGVADEVNISESTCALVKDFFECESRGKIAAKNKGELEMYIVRGLRPEFREAGSLIEPNGVFKERLGKMGLK